MISPQLSLQIKLQGLILENLKFDQGRSVPVGTSGQLVVPQLRGGHKHWPCSPARKSSLVKRFLPEFMVCLPVNGTQRVLNSESYRHGDKWCRNQPPAAIAEDQCFQYNYWFAPCTINTMHANLAVTE